MGEAGAAAAGPPEALRGAVVPAQPARRTRPARAMGSSARWGLPGLGERDLRETSSRGVDVNVPFEEPILRMLSRPCQFVTTGAKSSSPEDSVSLDKCGARIWTVRRNLRVFPDETGRNLAQRQEIAATAAHGAELDKVAEAASAGPSPPGPPTPVESSLI